MGSRFREIKWLAAGGMADVVLAAERTEQGASRTVVLKRVLAHLRAEDEFLRMFESEARLAMQLRHPNIVHVLEAGTDDGVPFIAMEALFGADVRTLVARAAQRREKLDVAVVCAIGLGVARGLQYAHTLRAQDGKPLAIVHRDISPHNVFVTRSGEVKILDFGIAKSADQLSITSTGIIKGKFRYMAPEQVKGTKLDARADIFALGTVIWETLVGRSLWRRDNDIATAQAVLGEIAQPPSNDRDDIPRALEDLVLSMLAKAPDARPTSAQDVGDRIEKILATLLTGTDRASDVLVRAVAKLCPEEEDPIASVEESQRGRTAVESTPHGAALPIAIAPAEDRGSHTSPTARQFGIESGSISRATRPASRAPWIYGVAAFVLLAAGVSIGVVATRGRAEPVGADRRPSTSNLGASANSGVGASANVGLDAGVTTSGTGPSGTPSARADSDAALSGVPGTPSVTAARRSDGGARNTHVGSAAGATGGGTNASTRRHPPRTDGRPPRILGVGAIRQ